MDELEITVSDLEEICRRQYEEIENKDLQIWDVEEENRVLRRSLEETEKELEQRLHRIDDLERWCTHLQAIIDRHEADLEKRNQQYQALEKKLGIFFKIARKLKRWIVG